MRIALQNDIPGLVEQLHNLSPDIEAFALGNKTLPQQDCTADVLLCAATPSENLSSLIRHCKGLRWVHVLGTGVDNFPLQLVRDKLVTCSRGATATPISEWVMSMMLAHEKQLPERWLSEPPESWYMADLGSLEHKTLGIVGFGTIGQALARRALAFDMKVIAKVRTHRTSPVGGVEFVGELKELLSVSDHVVLAVPSTPESSGMLNLDTLSAMKPGSHLINVSRARLVDQQALRQTLDSGQIARASLDVVEPEPLPAGHWMYRHPQIKLSAHISWSAPQMMERLLAPFLHNVNAFAHDRAMQGAVDAVIGY